jgi:hypothetical protein
MATPITKEALNSEVNTRFWALTAHKIGKPLDPKIPADKAMTKVWIAILNAVQKEAEAGTLVMTHEQPEVIEALADAQVASDVAAEHLRAAAAASDPETKQQHATAAAAAVQTATTKAREARAGQTLNLSPEIMQEAAREATSSALPASAPAEDQIAHVQMQNKLAQNGQPTSGSPSKDALYTETNHRFWRQYNYKPGQKLDMSDFQDQMMAEAWKAILSDVEREAREGRLVLTPPPFGVPQDPYAAPQGPPPQDFSQPQYGAYGAPPGMTPPQPYMPPQPQPQYGAYGAPPGLTPPTPPQYGAPQGFPQEPQYAAQQGFPQTPQYGAPQEMPVPQYGASQQAVPPQYGAPQDFSTPQYGAPQGFPTPTQPDFQAPQVPQAPQMDQQQPFTQQGFPQSQQAPQPQPQPQAPRGMEGFPQDLLQYAQQQAPQTPRSTPQPQQQAPQATPQRLNFQSPRGGADSSPRASASAALTGPSAAASTDTDAGWSTGAKIGVAVLAFGGLLTVVHVATRGSRHATIRDSSPVALLPSRSGRY